MQTCKYALKTFAWKQQIFIEREYGILAWGLFAISVAWQPKWKLGMTDDRHLLLLTLMLFGYFFLAIMRVVGIWGNEDFTARLWTGYSPLCHWLFTHNVYYRIAFTTKFLITDYTIKDFIEPYYGYTIMQFTLC